MPTTVDRMTKVPEADLVGLMNDFREIDEADIVTAFVDNEGTFTVESTVIVADHPTDLPGTPIVKIGKMSHFGGPNDMGVGPDEGLALFDKNDVASNPDIFLAEQPPNTTGEARRLNPDANYIACRWDTSATPRSFLRTIKVRVTANGKTEEARPVDFGPSTATGRVADLSPGLEKKLGLQTDDVCTVEIPTPQVGVAVGVNLAAIDKIIFPADMTRSLVVMTTSNNSTYWITNQIGSIEGGQTLLRRVGHDAPESFSATLRYFRCRPTMRFRRRLPISSTGQVSTPKSRRRRVVRRLVQTPISMPRCLPRPRPASGWIPARCLAREAAIWPVHGRSTRWFGRRSANRSRPIAKGEMHWAPVKFLMP
jgi:hypothetical protein